MAVVTTRDIVFGCVGWMVIGCITYFVLTRWKSDAQNGPIENVKNALLAHALHKVCNENEFHSWPMADYAKFDGTLLPSMSGSNLTQACFTYIQDKALRRKSLFHTKSMEDKAVAIEKFLARRLRTDDLAYEFVDAMVKACASSSTPAKDAKVIIPV